MRLLLDTHVLLWWLDDDPRLGVAAREAIAGADHAMVSTASAWEIGIKQSLGRLRGPEDLTGELAANRFDVLDIGLAHALAAAALPRHHDDPFDRMLIAQAAAEGLTLVTADAQILRYGVDVLRA